MTLNAQTHKHDMSMHMYLNTNDTILSQTSKVQNKDMHDMISHAYIYVHIYINICMCMHI